MIPCLPSRLGVQRVICQSFGVEVQGLGVLQQLDAVPLCSAPRPGIFSLCSNNRKCSVTRKPPKTPSESSADHLLTYVCCCWSSRYLSSSSPSSRGCSCSSQRSLLSGSRSAPSTPAADDTTQTDQDAWTRISLLLFPSRHQFMFVRDGLCNRSDTSHLCHAMIPLLLASAFVHSHIHQTVRKTNISVFSLQLPHLLILNGCLCFIGLQGRWCSIFNLRWKTQWWASSVLPVSVLFPLPAADFVILEYNIISEETCCKLQSVHLINNENRYY